MPTSLKKVLGFKRKQGGRGMKAQKRWLEKNCFRILSAKKCQFWLALYKIRCIWLPFRLICDCRVWQSISPISLSSLQSSCPQVFPPNLFVSNTKKTASPDKEQNKTQTTKPNQNNQKRCRMELNKEQDKDSSFFIIKAKTNFPLTSPTQIKVSFSDFYLL